MSDEQETQKPPEKQVELQQDTELGESIKLSAEVRKLANQLQHELQGAVDEDDILDELERNSTMSDKDKMINSNDNHMDMLDELANPEDIIDVEIEEISKIETDSFLAGSSDIPDDTDDSEDSVEYVDIDADELFEMMGEIHQLMQEQSKSIRALTREVKELRESVNHQSRQNDNNSSHAPRQQGSRPPRRFREQREQDGWRERGGGGNRYERGERNRDRGSRNNRGGRFERDEYPRDSYRDERQSDSFRPRQDRGSFSDEYRRDSRDNRGSSEEDRDYRPKPRRRYDRGWNNNHNDED